MSDTQTAASVAVARARTRSAASPGRDVRSEPADTIATLPLVPRPSPDNTADDGLRRLQFRTEIALPTTYNQAVGSRAPAAFPTSAANGNGSSERKPGRPMRSQRPLSAATVVLEWSPALVGLLQGAVEQRPEPGVGRVGG